MSYFLRRYIIRGGIAAVMLSASLSVSAQQSDREGVGVEMPVTEALQSKLVEAALAAMEADPGIESAVKDLLRPTYQQALEEVKVATGYAVKTASYREMIANGAAKIADLQEQLDRLPPLESVAPVQGSTEDLQKDIDSRRVAMVGLKDELSKVLDAIQQLKQRPVEVSARLLALQREKSGIDEQLALPEFAADSSSPTRVAARMLFKAKKSRILVEWQMLRQEDLSQPVREQWLRVQRDFLTRQVENSEAVLTKLETAFNQQIAADVKRAVTEAGIAREASEGEGGEVQALAKEVEGFAKEFEMVVAELKEVAAEHEKLKSRLKLLIREEQVIREQLKLGRAGKSMIQRLVGLRQRLPSRLALELQIKGHHRVLGELQLKALEVEEKMQAQDMMELTLDDSASGQKILASRREILGKLDLQYQSLVRTYGEWVNDDERYLDEVREVRAYLDDELFWVKSSPPMSLQAVTDIPKGLHSLLGGHVWPELGRVLVESGRAAWLRSLVVFLLLVILLAARKKFGYLLEQTGTQVRRVISDRYSHTGKALLYTFLLALPFPLFLAYAAWLTEQAIDPSPWLSAFSRGLWWSSLFALPLTFVIEACRKGGLVVSHFRWYEESATRMGRLAIGFLVPYIPMFMMVRLSFIGEQVDHFDSLGRSCFILVHLWSAWLLWRMFRSPDGSPVTFVRDSSHSLVARYRWLWLPIAIASPLILVVLACLGYLFTAVTISLDLVITEGIIAAGVILYWLTIRWFMIRERRLALAEALEERRAQRVASMGEEPEEAQSGEVVAVDLEEDQLDLASLGEQTRQLLEFLYLMAVIIAVGWLWSSTVPLFSGLDKIHTGHGFSLLDLGQAVLILIIIVMSYRNLPGLLELAFSGKKTIEKGKRVAIVTLCQYGLVAVGLVLFFGVLNVDWAKFGWIAAALSVGLGFGLQEVVANFVCGLILLFEQPVRVGDVVTVEGTTGTVTRIRMRAITIINWDRQELVVPNKTIVTQSILNWTLSNAVNRVVITVGVAYGSDTGRAREILLEVAETHPLVLDDPAPIATFEQFDDSNLNLLLRAYLPDLENRLRTITELHDAIDRRFAEEGIIIAFPQRVLHLETVGEGVIPPAVFPPSR